MLRLSVLLATTAAAFNSVKGATVNVTARDNRSLYVYNNCGDTVMAHSTFDTTTHVYPLNAHQGTFVDSLPPDNVGIAVNFYTGCTDNTAVTCKTGGVWSAGGATPFIRGEVTWKNGVPWYNLSPLYGYNRSLKINTDDPKCDTFQCNINSGCPVPGPDGTCFAPCCASAQGCEGTNNCGLDAKTGWARGGKGVHSDFYHNACPNAYSFPADDQYGSLVVAQCSSNSRVTMTLCPDGGSSHLTK